MKDIFILEKSDELELDNILNQKKKIKSYFENFNQEKRKQRIPHYRKGNDKHFFKSNKLKKVELPGNNNILNYKNLIKGTIFDNKKTDELDSDNKNFKMGVSNENTNETIVIDEIDEMNHLIQNKNVNVSDTYIKKKNNNFNVTTDFFCYEKKNIFNKIKREKSSFLIVLSINPDILNKIKNEHKNCVKYEIDQIEKKLNNHEKNLRFDDKKKDNDFKIPRNVVKLNSLICSSNFKKLLKQNSNFLTPPVLMKSQFHVFLSEDEKFKTYKNKSFKKKLKKIKITNENIHIFKNSSIQFYHNTKSSFNYKIKCVFIDDMESFVLKMIPNIKHYKQLNHIYNNYIKNIDEISQFNTSLWVDFFHPKSIENVLISQKNIRAIKSWLFIAFSSVNILKKNNENFCYLIKEEKKNDHHDILKKKRYHVPILILQGAYGSCKSSTVYAFMNDLNGYIYEVNAGQTRGRKQIYGSLKEFCTTQILHKSAVSKGYQNGVILFEDVHLLFKQDKNFWNTVDEIISISKKPIIFTCENLSSIPKKIFKLAYNQNSVIYMDNFVSKKLLVNYLWLCCLAKGFVVNKKILKKSTIDLFNGNNVDLRKSLMNCQDLYNKIGDKFIQKKNYSIELKTKKFKKKKLRKLKSISEVIDAVSCTSIISSNTFSLLEHDTYENEFVSFQNLYEQKETNRKAFDYELNIGNYLFEYYGNKYDLNLGNNKDFYQNNNLRNESFFFILFAQNELKRISNGYAKKSTRLKHIYKLKKYHSISYYDNYLNSALNNSYIYRSTNNTFILTILPIIRLWINTKKLNENENFITMLTSLPLLKKSYEYFSQSIGSFANSKV